MSERDICAAATILVSKEDEIHHTRIKFASVAGERSGGISGGLH